MKEPFIKVRDLCYSYEEDDGRSVGVLKDFSIDIGRGEFIAVLGHNGSGKSTFAKILNLILSSQGGSVFIDGKEICPDEMTEDEVIEFRKKIGMVFQNPDNQLVATIVEDDVAFGPENLGIPSAEIRERVDKALSELGMEKYAKHEPHRLSGGQKQRVAIAGIMAMLPECIIFDESTAMLDPQGRSEVLDSIEKINREKGITVILITHYMDEAARADRVVVLDDGAVVFDGPPSRVFERESELIARGLDVPQCTALVHKLRAAGMKLEGDCLTVEQCAELIAREMKK
jgi:energy-coupling factor transport system ATP-binding protein